jgi:pentatricopeptide repeat protein
MICAGVKPDITSYNRVINACQKGEQWQLTLDLLAELGAAGIQPNAVTYGCVIDALHAAKEHQKVEELYLEMLQRGLTHYHWNRTPADKGMLDLHNFGIGMAAAVMRIVLRDMLLKSDKSESDPKSSSDAYVHDMNSDLHIITGHAMHRDVRVGSALQPVIINLLKQQGIDCHVNPNNKGRLLVKASDLQKYVATATSQK